MKIEFTNADGSKFRLDGSLNLEQLIKLGFVRIKMVHPEKPLEAGEWKADLVRER